MHRCERICGSGLLWVGLLLASSLGAQQPNSPQASLVFAGVDGPAWPIIAHHEPGLSPLTVEVTGGANQPFILSHSPAGLLASGIYLGPLGGYLDQDWSQGLTVLLDGFAPSSANPLNALAVTNAAGLSQWNISLSVVDPVAFPGLQAAVGDPSAPAGLRLTAATSLTLHPLCSVGGLGSDFQSSSAVTSSGEMVWNASGYLEVASQSTTYGGSGSDGAVSFGPGIHDIITTPGFPSYNPGIGHTLSLLPGGVLEATSITVAAGALLRVQGTMPLIWRCTGNVSIDGVIDCSAIRPSESGTYFGAPKAGQWNNLGWVADGGFGGPGGGAGGNGSPSGTIRSQRGEAGFGANLAGSPNPGTTPNAHYGGGEGGPGDTVNSTATPAALGGLGGAGGSAFTSGAAGLPLAGGGPQVPITACGGTVPTHLATPLPTGPTLAFVPPITLPTAGSGGGGGGDKFDAAPQGQNLDEQGGGGGGGGGCFHLSATGTITLGPGASILAQGVPGGEGAPFAGSGGSGSGGLIWIRTSSNLLIDHTVTMDVSGGGLPAGNLTCYGAPGVGGTGYIQLEDSDSVVPTNFLVLPVLGTSNHLGVLGPPTVAQGTAQSAWLDSGHPAPIYHTALVDAQLGNVAGASVTVEFQGAHESLTAPGNPDPLSAGPWVPAAGITPSHGPADPVDGFRFIRFRVTASYPTVPAPAPGATRPRVNSVFLCR